MECLGILELFLGAGWKEILTHVLYSVIPCFHKSLVVYKPYRTLNAITAKSENFPLEFNTRIELKNITIIASDGVWFY
jgi:hypothetical protein